ncbi:hypothetical protein K8R33_04790 [archaeon]|nr:hypothetical protein [archaeon]
MQTFKKLTIEANRHLRLADHMTYVTYPMLKETKLLLSILMNIDKALKKALDAYLHYERLYKRISFFPDDFQTKLDIFQRSAGIRHDLRQYPQLIKEIDSILKKHKESPVEFVKGDKLIICSQDYRTRTLQISDVKTYLIKAKPFIFRLSNILKEDEFNRRRKR